VKKHKAQTKGRQWQATVRTHWQKSCCGGATDSEWFQAVSDWSVG